MRKGTTLVFVLIFIIVASVGGFILYKSTQKSTTKSIVLETVKDEVGKIVKDTDKFSEQKKSLHFETASPAHTQSFVSSPMNVVINFNFDLHEISEIKIEKDGLDYSEGNTIVDQGKLSMRKKLKKDLPDGVYTVTYSACWPDKSCHDGLLQFEIDSSLKDSYIDMTGKSEVMISMDDIAFNPAKIIISKGTKITWKNNESVAHYINTDPHAGHNHYPLLNSKSMEIGDTYSYIFNEPGEYPYHCSAHAVNMMGRILVVE